MPELLPLGATYAGAATNSSKEQWLTGVLHTNRYKYVTSSKFSYQITRGLSVPAAAVAF